MLKFEKKSVFKRLIFKNSSFCWPTYTDLRRAITWHHIIVFLNNGDGTCLLRGAKLIFKTNRGYFSSFKAVPWLRPLAGDLSPPRPELNPRPIHVRLAGDKVALGQVFLRVFRFLLLLSFHQCSTLIFTYTLLLPEGQTSEARYFPKLSAVSEIGKQCVESRMWRELR